MRTINEALASSWTVFCRLLAPDLPMAELWPLLRCQCVRMRPSQCS